MNDRADSRQTVFHDRRIQVLVTMVRLVLGTVFLSAGITKIVDPAGFALAVYNYHILPAWLVNLAAVTLPWIEVVAGVCLVLGLWVPGSALVVSVLLLAFTTALGFNMYRGLDITCGCFSTSPGSGKITWWYVLRDGSLFLSGLLVLFADQGRFSLSSALQGTDRNHHS